MGRKPRCTSSLARSKYPLPADVIMPIPRLEWLRLDMMPKLGRLVNAYILCMTSSYIPRMHVLVLVLPRTSICRYLLRTYLCVPIMFYNAV